MDDDTARIHSEIDRLTLHTTDPRPLRLFHERSALQKRVKAWKYGGLAVALLAGVAAFFLWFSDTDNGLLKAGAVALAVFCVIALIGRKDLDAKAKDWLARARQLVGASLDPDTSRLLLKKRPPSVCGEAAGDGPGFNGG